MMLERIGRVALPSLLAGLAAWSAHAEIYTWVDATGTTNVSNLPPPEGAKVTKVQPAPPPEVAAREQAAFEAARRAETDALAQRVRDLEALAARSPPPDYRPPVPPPVIQYIVEPQPAPMQLTVEMAQPAYSDYGCNPSWASCALWWPGYYGGFVVVGTPGRPTHPIHGGRPMPSPQPPPMFGPKLTNVAAPVTNFVPQLTSVVPPVTGFVPPLTNIVAPIPKTSAVQPAVNASLGFRRG